MAVANVGALLYRLGFKTLIVDWDLEAPGIENYYKDYSDLNSIDQKEGLIDFCRELRGGRSSRGRDGRN